MKKFELFMGCLGNGITVCNKAVEENGDYKHIAHISECGKITWYVAPPRIPGDALMRIEHAADAKNAHFEKWLSELGEYKAYEYLLDNVPHIAFMHAINMDGDIWEKIQYLKGVFYQKTTF